MRYIVWVKPPKEEWQPNGDGPMGKATAERVAKEILRDFRIGTRVLIEGAEPRDMERRALIQGLVPERRPYAPKELENTK